MAVCKYTRQRNQSSTQGGWIKTEEGGGLVLVLLSHPFVLSGNVSDGIHVGPATDSAGGRSNSNGQITVRAYKEQERVTEEEKESLCRRHQESSPKNSCLSHECLSFEDLCVVRQLWEIIRVKQSPCRPVIKIPTYCGCTWLLKADHRQIRQSWRVQRSR